MARLFIGFVVATICLAQDANPIEAILNFEAGLSGTVPAGWSVTSANVFLDGEIFHGGKYSARIERTVQGGANGGIYNELPMDFKGSMIELRGFLRSKDVTQGIDMWLREDGASGSLAVAGITKLGLKGTTDWKQYSVQIPVRPKGVQIAFGVSLSGTGKVWADDFELLVDGQPVWLAPKAEVLNTVIETDHEYDAGSRIKLARLTPAQIDNLVTLGKVWGFLKYHHPAVVNGKRHWDYDLFRVMPQVLAASSRAGANAAIARWVNGLGELPPCSPCVSLLQEGVQLLPEIAWLDNRGLLGSELSAQLRAVYQNRPASNKQFYLSQVPLVKNAIFDHELEYQALRIPDPGFQILALYRFWNIIEYWFPYRDVIGESWEGVLRDTLPKIALAKDRDAYQLEMLALIARIHDSHAWLKSSIQVQPPVGDCKIPANVRFIDGRAVVTSDGAELQRGDIITDLDGTAVAKLVQTWTPYYAASNERTRLRDIAGSMTRGLCGAVHLRVQRGAMELEVKSLRVRGPWPPFTADKEGDAFQRLSREVGYLKLSSIESAEAAKYVAEAAGTKGLIIDIRGYPPANALSAIGSLLVDRDTEFARITRGDPSNPGAFYWSSPSVLRPRRPHYPGKIMILVDENSQSASEFAALAFRAAAGAKVIGSTTAGADGNVSLIDLPGGIASRISGIGIFYPDKRPTQRVGIVPDIEVKRTINGVREGRDELIEAAIREIGR